MKGAIFDVDGTLLDSMGVWFRATKTFFETHELHIPTAELTAYQSMTLEESLPLIQRKYLKGIPLQEMLGNLFEIVQTAYSDTIPEKRGACEYLRRLHEQGVKIAIATSGYAELCQVAFKRLGVYELIDAYAFSSEVGCNKSNPDIYLLAASRLGIEPQNCTVYEDLINGIESAGAVGFKTVAIADVSNASVKDRLIQRSDRYITGWDELLSNI